MHVQQHQQRHQFPERQQKVRTQMLSMIGVSLLDGVNNLIGNSWRVEKLSPGDSRSQRMVFVG